MDPGPKSPNNKFVESGRKNWSESRIKILIYGVKWKESHMHIYKKYPRTWPVSMIDNEELFLFTIVFLLPFSLFFSLLFLFPSPFSVNLLSCYILLFLHHFLHPRVSQVLGVFFFYSPSPLLEPSTLNCKAVCLLFRHHLHINAARELAGQHLMRGWQYFLIFVFPHPYPLFVYPLCCKVLLKRYLKGLRSLLATSDRGSEVVIILGHD